MSRRSRPADAPARASGNGGTGHGGTGHDGTRHAWAVSLAMVASFLLGAGGMTFGPRALLWLGIALFVVLGCYSVAVHVWTDYVARTHQQPEVGPEWTLGQATVTDELWRDFHATVNMSSGELEDWLRANDARAAAEPRPDEDGSSRLGRRVLEIMGKPRGNVNAQDAQVMRQVVDAVSADRGGRRPLDAPGADDAARRGRLMRLGHDPSR